MGESVARKSAEELNTREIICLCNDRCPGCLEEWRDTVEAIAKYTDPLEARIAELAAEGLSLRDRLAAETFPQIAHYQSQIATLREALGKIIEANQCFSNPEIPDIARQALDATKEKK